MTYTSTILVALAVATGMFTSQGKEATGSAALQGTWTIESINGKSAQEGTPPLTLSFDGDKYSQAVGTDVNERGAFKLDASKKPMPIDLDDRRGRRCREDAGGDSRSGRRQVAHLLCDTRRDRRPADFIVKEGFLMVLGSRKK